VIIANNDTMAISAVEALQAQGYNKGDNTLIIPVFGIIAIAVARDLIKKGFMMGTVSENHRDITEALFILVE